jgi:predicted house-cleaning noncanonical NTP pyrophosphatase (MazG superfamily)
MASVSTQQQQQCSRHGLYVGEGCPGCKAEAPREPPIGRPRLVKIVRDRMGELLPGSEIHYAPVEDHGLAVEHLRKKLVEEAVEYALDPSITELADVLEAVRALAHVDLDTGMRAVEREAHRKLVERGRFDGLTGMWVTTSPDPFDEKGQTRK